VLRTGTVCRGGRDLYLYDCTGATCCRRVPHRGFATVQDDIGVGVYCDCWNCMSWSTESWAGVPELSSCVRVAITRKLVPVVSTS
jgi:hypothetical protein